MIRIGRKIKTYATKTKTYVVIAIILASTIATIYYLKQQYEILETNKVSIAFQDTYIETQPGIETTLKLQITNGKANIIVIEYNDGTEQEAIISQNGITGTKEIKHRFMAEGIYTVIAIVIQGTGANIQNQSVEELPIATCVVNVTNRPPTLQLVLGPPQTTLPPQEQPPSEGELPPPQPPPPPRPPRPPQYPYHPYYPRPTSRVAPRTHQKVFKTRNGQTVFIINETDELMLSAIINDTDYDKKRMRVFWRINGITSENTTVTVSFNDSGVYPGYLAVIDPWGAVDCEYFFIVVRNTPPVAGFFPDGNIRLEGDVIIVPEDEPIVLNASPTYDTPNDEDKLRYIWFLGDGTVREGMAITHRYVNEGEYTVELCVIDPEGARSYAYATIRVVNPSPSIDVWGPTCLEEGNTYIFYANVSDNPSDIPFLDISWSIDGNGTVAYFTPMDDGDYVVSSTVADDNGEYATDSVSVSVSNTPPTIFFNMRFFTTIHINITGFGWNYTLVKFFDNGYLADLLNISNTGGNYTYVNISYSFHPYHDYDINITPVFLDTSIDPWAYINITFEFIDGSTRPFEVHIYYINGTPNYAAWESEGVFEVSIINESWNIWINPEEICEDAPATIMGYVFDQGKDKVWVSVEYMENGETVMVENYTLIPDEWPAYMYFTINTTINGDAAIIGYARDDDGGECSVVVNITRYEQDGWDIIPMNLAPHPLVIARNMTEEDAEIAFTIIILDHNEGNYSVRVEFGDGSYEEFETNMTMFVVTHKYNYSGEYLVRCYIEYNGSRSVGYKKILVVNSPPEIYVPEEVVAYEGEKVTLHASWIDTESDREHVYVGWNILGLGYCGENVELWPNDSGIFQINVFAVDDDGCVAEKTIWLRVLEKAPVIDSPTTFTVYEGDPIKYYVWINDNPADIARMNVTIVLEDNLSWMLDTYIVFDNITHTMVDGKVIIEDTTQFVLWLDDGNYTLTVTLDDGKNTTTKQTEIKVLNIKPMVSISTYSFVRPETTTIIIKAYAIDIFVDIQDIKYTWEIPRTQYTATTMATDTFKTELQTTIHDIGIENSTDIEIFVEAKDETMKDTKTTKIRLHIDNDQDGIADDIGIWRLFPDTDNDTLFDPIEKVIGTDPNDNDTDDDEMMDGTEYFGWMITIKTQSGEIRKWVSSDPTKQDTDGDGLNDTYERDVGLDPRRCDTDGDGLSDTDEILLNTTPTNWDTDGDALGDGYEHQRGTDPLSTDTDNDGLDDYVEIHVYGTDPTLNDTDHDGLLDGQETISLEYSLDKKYNMTHSGWYTFETYVPVSSSQQTTITIGLSGIKFSTGKIKIRIEKDGTIKGYREIDATEELRNRGVLVETIQLEGETGICGKWKLKIYVPGQAMLDTYKITITTHTDRKDSDTDDDGLKDGEEVLGVEKGGIKIWTNPLLRDTDGDGISDKAEINMGTNPLNPDSDQDGVRDDVDNAPTGNLLVRIKINKAKIQYWEEYWVLKTQWGWPPTYWDGPHNKYYTEDTSFCPIIDTEYIGYILPKKKGNGEATYSGWYYIDVPDDAQNIKVRIELWAKGWTISTFLGLDWKKAATWEDWYGTTVYEDHTLETGWTKIKWYHWLVRKGNIYVKARVELRIEKYEQKFTNILLIAKPDFVAKPDTEYVVIMMRMGTSADTRIIVVPRETFTETKMGTIVMREEVDRLGGFKEANITGFGKGEVAKGIYGLITFIGATETLYNNIISMLLVNDSDATIAKKHTTYPTWIMPGSIIRMIPLHDLPDRGPSLPPEESPATPIWAKIVNTIMEVGRTLWNLFVAGVSFIAELLEKVAEWGLRILGTLWEAIKQVANIVKFILKIIAEIVGIMFWMLVMGAETILSRFVSSKSIGSCLQAVLTGPGFLIGLYMDVMRMDPGLGFDVPFLLVSLNISLVPFGVSLLNISFYACLSSLYIGTTMNIDVSIGELTFAGVAIPENIARIFLSPEFGYIFPTTLFSQYLMESALISVGEVSVLAAANNWVMGSVMYGIGLGIWAYSYLSMPESDIERICFTMACIPTLIFGFIETILFFFKVWRVLSAMESVESSLGNLLTYAEHITFVEKIKQIAFKASLIYYSLTIFSIAVASAIVARGYAPLGILPDLILFILEIALSRIIPNTLFLLYFFFKIKDFEEKLIGTVFRYGTIGNVKLFTAGISLVSGALHIFFIYWIISRFIAAWDRYMSSSGD